MKRILILHSYSVIIDALMAEKITWELSDISKKKKKDNPADLVNIFISSIARFPRIRST